MTRADAPERRTPPKVPRPERAPLTTSPAVGKLWDRLGHHDHHGGDADEEQRLLAEFWADAGARTPVIEPIRDAPDERIVTFLWRDAAATQVLLFVNRITDERALGDSLMRRIPGTDVWHLSYRMRTDWRASYSFLVRRPGQRAPWTDGADQIAVRAALDQGHVDPRNPRTGRNRDGLEQSVVSLPDAPADTWLHPRGDVGRGTVTPLTAPDGRRVWVYEPAGGLPAGAPILVALDGEVWTGSQDLPTTLDNLVADGRIRPPLVLMPDSGGRAQRWREMDAQGDAAAWVADLLLPWARAGRDVSAAASDVVVAGQSLGGLTALRLAIGRPDAVGAVLSQSASLWQDDLSGVLAGADVSGLRAYLEVGTQEWVLREPNRALAARMRDAGAAVRLVEYNGGHDYACWRVGIAAGLADLLAPASGPPRTTAQGGTAAQGR